MGTDKNYLTVPQLKAAVEPAGTFSSQVDNSLYERAIAAASRLLDEWCFGSTGGHFWQTTTAEPRLFVADTPEWTCIDLFDTTAGVTVETDPGFDGTFDIVWTVDTDWAAYPYVRVNGWPYKRIFAVGSKRFPVGNRRPGLKVTAKWGWGEVPDPVVQACQTLAVVFYKSKDFVNINQSDLDSVHLAKKMVMPYVCEGGRLYGMDQR